MSGDETAQEIRYADQWKVSYNQPGEFISVDEAQRRHMAGERYVALLKQGEQRIVVDNNLEAGLINVYFLDDKRRWTTKYLFQRLDDGRLWLQQVGNRKWLDDSRYRYDSTTIRNDGRMYAERGILGDRGEKEVMERRLDPATLLFLNEPVPQFGDYRSITRYERDPAQQLPE
jgi:hypothetical protein